MTSIGCGNSKDATPPSVYEVLKDVLAQKEKAENVLSKYYTNMVSALRLAFASHSSRLVLKIESELDYHPPRGIGERAGNEAGDTYGGYHGDW